MRLSPLIDLGADRTRMRDSRDVRRQTHTAQVILDRFFHDDPDRRFELQIVADEVGMGKTFVALAVAFSLLEAARQGHVELRGSYGRLLVLTPANDALFDKWNREVTEFVKRCVPGADAAGAKDRFRPARVKRIDELVAALRATQGPEVVIAKTSSLGGRVRDFDVKARIVLSTVFRVWGNSFRLDDRERMLKGAKRWGWPQNPRELGFVHQAEATVLPIKQDEIDTAVESMMRRPSEGDAARFDALLSDRGLRQVEPRLRVFFREALRLYASNRDLSQELGDLVVRHRRHTDHRLARIGREFEAPVAEIATRPDRQILHAAPGIDVQGGGELPHYLLMRATSELQGGGRKAALGSSMTGCYSTLFASAESKQFERAAKGTNAGLYVDLLRELVGTEAADATHPKMRAVVRDTLERWEQGEKTLVFAFRNNTANRLAALLREGMQERIEERKRRCMGSENGLRTLRQRITSKDRDLIPLVLDRVLWSSLWAPPGNEARPFGPEELLPQREDYDEVAALALTFGVDLLDKLVDRVFLQRAVECAVARRLRGAAAAQSRFRRMLDEMAEPAWVARAYGGTDAGDASDADDAMIDERGVHSVYAPVTDNPDGVPGYARQLLERDAAARRSGQRSIVRTAFDGPSLWLGASPTDLALERWHLPADVEADIRDERLFHIHLTTLTWPGMDPDWRTRAIAIQAVRRAALREAMLARLLPSGQELEEDGWGPVLVERFTAPLSEGGESMLRRLGVFLEDVASAGGSVDDASSPRGALIDATKSRGESGVSLVDGGTKPETRTRLFTGFNTPLLPEILICTAVGQEGIDLHRQCKNVVHYDLAWNPATLEQRTGRVDRIGCAALRERKLSEQAESAARNYLEVGVPYLAGTYDERMFEELRLRAQTFEVLTGGEFAPERADGRSEDGEQDDEGQEAEAGLVTLPREMVEELRVNLAVWREGEGSSTAS